MKIINLYALSAKMDLLWILKDTKLFVIIVFADLVSSISSLTGMFLLAWKFNGVGGLDKFEVLFMLGYVTIVTGCFQMFFAGSNVGHISRVIGRGQFEHIFIQPVSIPIQLLTSGFIPFSGGSNCVVGCLILCLSIKNLNYQINVFWIFGLIGSTLVSIIIILSLSYIFSTAAFYAPIQAEEISSYVIDSTGILSTYPLSGMPMKFILPLITIFPTGLLGWFPSLVLLKKNPLNLPELYPVFIACILFVIAYEIFRKGLRYYVKEGTNRYSDIGHRR
ncbi:MAG: ABC-2 family transporter protein [Clostridiales bacterium]